MIAHNEEAKIDGALKSASFADEIIVVDCDSSDSTGKIAAELGATVFTRPNLENLNVNKNFSFEQSIGEWIFCLDADEVISEELSSEIIRKIAEDPNENAFFVPRRNHYFGSWLKHGGQYPDYQLRLVRRAKARFPAKHVHERITVEGKIGRLKSPLLHFPYSTKEEADRKLDFYTSFEAAHLFERGATPSWRMAFRYLLFKPVTRFLRRYIIKLGFLDGQAGFEAIKMDMANFRLRYRKLVQMYQQQGIK